MTTSTTTATPVTGELTPISLLPLYLSLVSVLNLKCKNVNSSEVDIKAACDAMTLSVRKYRSFLAPLGKILPTAADMIKIDGLEFDPPSFSVISPETYKKIVKRFHKIERLYPTSLRGDQIHGGFFNPEQKQIREEKGKGAEGIILTEDDFVDIVFTILEQTRLARIEAGSQHDQIKGYLIASLLPQALILLLVVAQYLLMRHRTRKAKKRNEKIAREQQLLGRLMEMRQPPRMVE